MIESKNQQTLIKTPHKKESYTQAQILEFSRCAHPETGPEYFLRNYFYIQHPTRGSIKCEPFDYQIELIHHYHNYKKSINLLPRQSGKTTIAACYLLWFAMFMPDSTVLVSAHKYTGAQEIMTRIRYAYETTPDFIRCGVTTYNKGSIDFDNGSRIVSTTTTETTGRGMSISLLYLDEFAYVRTTIASAMWASVAPTLATGGKSIITSTPNSDEDQFATMWKLANHCIDSFGNETNLGSNGFKSYQVHWSEHPDRDQAWADGQLAELGEEKFRREILCEFVVFAETLIDSLYLTTMFPQNPIEKQGQVRWYEHINKKGTYVIGLDPSMGTGGDNSAIQVFELPTFKQVAEWQHNKTSIQQQVRILRDISQTIYEKTNSDTSIYYSVENNSLGEAALVAIDDLGEQNIHGIFLSEPVKRGKSRIHRKGFTTTHTSKTAVCAKFKQLIETNKLHIASKNLISELKTFVAGGATKTTYNALPGAHDDLVSATLLVLRMIQVIQEYDEETNKYMRELPGEEMILPMPFIML